MRAIVAPMAELAARICRVNELAAQLESFRPRSLAELVINTQLRRAAALLQPAVLDTIVTALLVFATNFRRAFPDQAAACAPAVLKTDRACIPETGAFLVLSGIFLSDRLVVTVNGVPTPYTLKETALCLWVQPGHRTPFVRVEVLCDDQPVPFPGFFPVAAAPPTPPLEFQTVAGAVGHEAPAEPPAAARAQQPQQTFRFLSDPAGDWWSDFELIHPHQSTPRSADTGVSPPPSPTHSPALPADPPQPHHKPLSTLFRHDTPPQSQLCVSTPVATLRLDDPPAEQHPPAETAPTPPHPLVLTHAKSASTSRSFRTPSARRDRHRGIVLKDTSFLDAAAEPLN